MKSLKFRAFQNGKMRYDVTGFECGKANEMAGVFLDGDYHKIGKDCVVMQFTGLQDKNGTDIYEGDNLTIITSFNQSGEPLSSNSGFVIYNESAACFEMRPHDHQRSNNVANALRNYAPRCEWIVTGNVHATPEMINPAAATNE